ncbi:AraC family transcriptional regulator [Actinoallomurus sp. CA-150999]|uniref:AraC family transcriptional regulator n=1 Tax=Actinoallomurus sp. CA-150999 TaxID=3239887 RepID=UPI003D8B2933
MSDLAELRARITRLTAGHHRPRWIDDIYVFATATTTRPLGTVAKPVLALVAQGAKRSMLGDQVFDYRAGQFLVVTVDLPLTSQITQASADEPFLAFGLPLEPSTIAQLLLHGRPPAAPVPDGPALSVSTATPELLDAVVRLLRLADSPGDQRVLAPAAKMEIHWRLLTGPQGGLVRQIGTADGRLALVARAIAWIDSRYDEVIRIDDLAADVGLSVSSLNRHFRAVTSMSPLQYQKQLRLQRARLRLLADPTDIAGAGHAVGYTSASQFSREYRRLFGMPPSEDALRLQSDPVVVE